MILKAHRLAHDHAQRERAAVAVKTWVLAQMDKNGPQQRWQMSKRGKRSIFGALWTAPCRKDMHTGVPRILSNLSVRVCGRDLASLDFPHRGVLRVRTRSHNSGAARISYITVTVPAIAQPWTSQW